MKYAVIGLLSVLVGGAVFGMGQFGYHLWGEPSWYQWANVAAGTVVAVYFLFVRLAEEREWERA
jgi:hypothetical protein